MRWGGGAFFFFISFSPHTIRVFKHTQARRRWGGGARVLPLECCRFSSH
jgi:hypothetical protein